MSIRSLCTLRFALAVLLCLGGSVSCLPAQPPIEYTFEIVRTFPHDPDAFTQGLEYHDGVLYEGTGLNGRSSLRKVRLETGEILQRTELSPEFFGEGITVLQDKIVQVTWQSQIGFVYDARDLRLLRRFNYPGEGWGLTTDGTEIFMSDGTAEIRVLDGATLAEKRRILVRDGSAPVNMLNELEYVAGEIYANVWQTDRIARISPRTGNVIGWIDMSGLPGPPSRDVLNGIAYDSEHKRLFVTGKLWPNIFEIRVIPKNSRGVPPPSRR